MRLISFFCCERGVKKRKGDVLVNYHQGCYSNSFKDCLVGLLGAIESSSDCSVVFHFLLMQGGQGCLVLSDHAVTCGPACAPTTALAPSAPAARCGQSCLRRELLPAERKWTESQGCLLTFLPSRPPDSFRELPLLTYLLLVSLSFITSTHLFPRRASAKKRGTSDKPAAEPQPPRYSAGPVRVYSLVPGDVQPEHPMASAIPCPSPFAPTVPAHPGVLACRQSPTKGLGPARRHAGHESKGEALLATTVRFPKSRFPCLKETVSLLFLKESPKLPRSSAMAPV